MKQSKKKKKHNMFENKSLSIPDDPSKSLTIVYKQRNYKEY